MSQDNFGVAMTHEVCIACGAKCNETIVMNTRLTPLHKQHVDNMHGKAIAFTWCAECKPVHDSGAVFLVEIDDTKSTIENGILKPENAYRTGKVIALKREAYDRIVDTKDKDGIIFVDIGVIDKIMSLMEQ